MNLLLGGTSEARAILELLQKHKKRAVATTVTSYGGSLASGGNNLEIVSRAMNESDLDNLVAEKNIKTVIDATHPFAAKITEVAIDVCERNQINYIRFERPKLELEMDSNLVQWVEDFEAAAEAVGSMNCPFLLTSGSKNLGEFFNHPKIKKENIYARVLPDPQVMQKCMDLGSTPKQIIAVQGPCTYEFNAACYKQLNINAIVTKESGTRGGFKEKIQAAIDLGLQVVVIKRPKIAGMEIAEIVWSIEEIEKIIKERL
ncbi:precorrin-6A/cobalt-precorrin-6A reductase [Desulfitispora alkaliphila]|uniref:precorrin-6A reductase n=1 Tax=Desulfitispora alkaliphila TaxID=622674 RepID=UPI003D1C3965